MVIWWHLFELILQASNYNSFNSLLTKNCGCLSTWDNCTCFLDCGGGYCYVGAFPGQYNFKASDQLVNLINVHVLKNFAKPHSSKKTSLCFL